MSSRRDAALERSAPGFAALGDRTRLRLVSSLSKEGPMSITELTAGTDVTRQAVTKHLRVLSEAGLVRDFAQGRRRVWELETRRIIELQALLDRVSSRWDDALERLRNLVED